MRSLSVCVYKNIYIYTTKIKVETFSAADKAYQAQHTESKRPELSNTIDKLEHKRRT